MYRRRFVLCLDVRSLDGLGDVRTSLSAASVAGMSAASPGTRSFVASLGTPMVALSIAGTFFIASIALPATAARKNARGVRGSRSSLADGPSEALAARMVRRLRYSHCEENKLRAPFFRNLRPSFARSTWPRECRCRARRSPASSWGPGCWPRSSGRRPTRRGRRAWSWTRQKCFCPPVRMDPSTTTSLPSSRPRWSRRDLLASASPRRSRRASCLISRTLSDQKLPAAMVSLMTNLAEETRPLGFQR